jgi:hypothetical protein
MAWKRPRDRYRKLPAPKERGLGFGVHWGRYQKIPKVPGGPEIILSASGEVREIPPWSLWKWALVLITGAVTAVVVFPFLFTWIFWAGLGATLLVLTYRTWRS